MSATQPAWVAGLSARLAPAVPAPPPGLGPGQRASAVLALFDDAGDPSLVFTVRSRRLAHHPGQISFPGGGLEAGDAYPAGTALREAAEEVGLDAAATHVIGLLPGRAVPVSNNLVVPVVAWTTDTAGLHVRDSQEVSGLRRWRVSQLADPAHRVMAAHPRGGAGPAWQFGDDFLWGFTARLVDDLLRLGGWHRPWDATRVVPVRP